MPYHKWTFVLQMGYKVVVDFCFVLLCFQGSLTLEEKQKLAKEQEQAQKLKSQQPLKPQVHTPIAPVKQVCLSVVSNSECLSARGSRSHPPLPTHSA